MVQKGVMVINGKKGGLVRDMTRFTSPAAAGMLRDERLCFGAAPATTRQRLQQHARAGSTPRWAGCSEHSAQVRNPYPWALLSARANAAA
jgi:hypothetical protein